jgi:predicted ATP-grasp superfamily ATP-dependent carboligase
MPDTPPIDRYLDLEDEEITISKDLEASNDRINEVKEQLEHFAKLLKEAGATSLHASKDLREAEKKRLWNIMTKEEVRELGRRDVERKRQRVE